jgi:predicted SprT family Zn-dependent metalloprotease
MRVSSTFRIVKKSGLNPYYNILINESLFALNSIKDIKAVLRHTLIHVCQLNAGKRRAHTKEFSRISDILKAEDPKILKRASSSYKTFYFICPDGCQQFSSTDEPKVNCFYCGKEMKKYNSEQYQKYKKMLRGKI